MSQPNPSPVLTIGYGGDSLIGLIERLLAAEVSHVADVRSVPFSRARPEFNGPDLQVALKASGIGYAFLGRQLGGRPDDATCYTSDDRVDYGRIRGRAWFREGLERVHAGAKKRLTLCLLCSEGHPETCHRAKLVSEALVDDLGLDVLHIEPDGRLTPHSEVVDRWDSGQQTLGFVDVRNQSSAAYEVSARGR